MLSVLLSRSKGECTSSALTASTNISKVGWYSGVKTLVLVVAANFLEFSELNTYTGIKYPGISWNSCLSACKFVGEISCQNLHKRNI